MRQTLWLPVMAGLMALASVSHAQAAEEKRMERTITISASGTVSAEPDMARITTGVTSEADTAREALSRNSEAMARVIAGLKSHAIEAKDIQTTSFHLEPRYTNPKDNRPAVINGYRVTNQVVVTARDLKRLGEVLDALVSVGANQMGGLNFEVSKADLLTDEARKRAIANARRKAELYATAAGVALGPVVTISEGAEHNPVPVLRGGVRAQMAKAVPIEAGTEQLEVSVTVTWELK